MSQTAMQPAHQGFGKFEDAGRNPGRIHQVTGENKKRYGNQWKTINSADHAMQDDNTRRAFHQNKQQGADSQRHCHRRTDN